jgi:hypothetical protein
MTLFIRLFQGSSMAVKAVQIFQGHSSRLPVTSLGFDCWTSSKISSAESHTERRCSKQQQNGGKDRTKHTLQNISRKAVARERSDKYSLHFIWRCENVHWEATVTYSTSSTTTFSNECRWKSALQVAHLLFHNDNESEKHFSDSLHFRFISSTADTTVLRPKSAKIFKRQQQQQQHSPQVHPNEIPQTDRRKKHMNLLHLLLLDRIPNQTEQTSQSTLLAE